MTKNPQQKKRPVKVKQSPVEEIHERAIFVLSDELKALVAKDPDLLTQALLVQACHANNRLINSLKNI